MMLACLDFLLVWPARPILPLLFTILSLYKTQYGKWERGVGLASQTNFLPTLQLFLWNMKFELQLLLEPQVNKLPPPSCSDFYLAYGENEVHV